MKMPRVKLAMGSVVVATTFLCAGCSKRVYTTRDRWLLSRDSITEVRVQFDSIWERDSIYVEVRGDTLRHEVHKWRYRDRILRDTVERLRQDTVVRIEQRPAEAPAPALKWRERLFLNIGKGALCIVALGSLILIIRFLCRKSP